MRSEVSKFCEQRMYSFVENSALLDYYAAKNSNSLATFRDNQLDPSNSRPYSENGNEHAIYIGSGKFTD